MKKKLLLSLLCILQSVLFALQAQNTQRNIAYTDDNVRFTVISDGALRLEYAPVSYTHLTLPTKLEV